MAILMSVVFLMSIQAGFCIEQSGSCRPVCTGEDCITFNKDSMDFKRAEEACRDRHGELVTFQSEPDQRIIDILNRELNGDFWIGLRLPANACSNLSAPLRGYQWISGNAPGDFTPSSHAWKDSVQVCSPHCVSLSNDGKWTERLCSDQAGGFLCRTKHKHACLVQELLDSYVFKSSKGCSSGPCEHKCKDVEGGYRCSCFHGYMPDNSDPRRCKIHCAHEKCPAICHDGKCECPQGFLDDEGVCTDIDECSGGWCDQGCKNTFGSYTCSCREGFVLERDGKCVNKTVTPVLVGVVKPATNGTLTGSSLHAGGFLWIWIFVAVAVVVLIFVIRTFVVKRQKRREQNIRQQSSAPVDNIEY